MEFSFQFLLSLYLFILQMLELFLLVNLIWLSSLKNMSIKWAYLKWECSRWINRIKGKDRIQNEEILDFISMIHSYPRSVYPFSMKANVKMPMCSSSNGTSSEVMAFRSIGCVCKDQLKKKGNLTWKSLHVLIFSGKALNPHSCHQQ